MNKSSSSSSSQTARSKEGILPPSEEEFMSFAQLRLWLSEFENKEKSHPTKVIKPRKDRDETSSNSFSSSADLKEEMPLLSIAGTSSTSSYDSTSPPRVGQSIVNSQSDLSTVVVVVDDDRSIMLKDKNFHRGGGQTSFRSRRSDFVNNVSTIRGEFTELGNKKTIVHASSQTKSYPCQALRIPTPRTTIIVPAARTNSAGQIKKTSTEKYPRHDEEASLDNTRTEKSHERHQIAPSRGGQEQDIESTIRKFGGGPKASCRTSIIEKRKQQLEKKWGEYKKPNPTTKVKWSVCGKTGKYKKTYVVDIERKKS